MKVKRSLLKRYITIQLDEAELEKLRLVKLGQKLSNRKIFMAMVDALQPVANVALVSDIVSEVLDAPTESPANIMTDETVIIEEE